MFNIYLPYVTFLVLIFELLELFFVSVASSSALEFDTTYPSHRPRKSQAASIQEISGANFIDRRFQFMNRRNHHWEEHEPDDFTCRGSELLEQWVANKFGCSRTNISMNQNGHYRLFKRFGCRNNMDLTQYWRALRIKPLFFAMRCILWIFSWILCALNTKILFTCYSEDVKGTLVKKTMQRKKIWFSDKLLMPLVANAFLWACSVGSSRWIHITFYGKIWIISFSILWIVNWGMAKSDSALLVDLLRGGLK